MELVIVNYSPRVYPHRPAYQVVKRLLDVVLCILAFPFLAPVLIACAIAIKLDSPGPVLFIQERIGKDGRPFRMFKFRTMKHNLDDSFHRAFMKAFVKGQMDGGRNGTGKNGQGSDPPGAFKRAFIEPHVDGKKNGAQKTYKPFQDSQVTWVGRFLRKTSLDELPQVWNVLRGEMSLVGPRPNVPWEVEEYEPWHYERLEVLPGITGLAQVKGRSSISFDEITGYDIEYIMQQSVAMDLKILWWTASAVFSGAGAE
jgi:lipopolysaccharide/colanic/teichoic acid biosynthesis glycosyltransferase